MDHLPSFRYMVQPYPRVPQVTLEAYDGLEFATYPRRKGFDADRLRKSDYSQHPMEQTASFLQSWLFFGVLHGAFSLETPINLDQFEKHDQQGPRICTRTLENCIKTWTDEMSTLLNSAFSGGPEGVSHGQKVMMLMTRHSNMMDTMHDIHRGLVLAGASPLPQDVTLSLAVLGCTLDQAMTWFWRGAFGAMADTLADRFLGSSRARTWGLDSTAAMRMTAAGWCPRDIALANDRLSELSMFCASYLERKTVTFDHWDCTSHTCLLNQIDNTTYVTQHRSPDCHCEHICPSQEDIRRILDEGKVAVILVTDEGTKTKGGERRLNVKVGYGGSVADRYIAISHVWSDGLGNPTANSLPLCQVAWLHDQLQGALADAVYEGIEDMVLKSGQDRLVTASDSISDRVLSKAIDWTGRNMKRIEPIVKPSPRPRGFWIDTLCVPLEKPYRNMAISRINKVYSKASMTVVLDSELQAVDHRYCGDQELAIRIGLSGWMRRAWTFQEGSLSGGRWLRFLFSNGHAALPLWKGEVQGALRDTMLLPPVALVMNIKAAMLVAKGGHSEIEAPPSDPPPASSIKYADKKVKQYFSLERQGVEETKRFFADLKALWSSISFADHPQLIAARQMGVWESMRIRATSREADKLLCFAITCAATRDERTRIHRLLDLPSGERAKGWVQLQRVVPAALLFIEGARYTQAGFRWLPKHFFRAPLDNDGQPFHYGLRKPGSDDLSFEKPGFLLDGIRDQEVLRGRFIISDTQITDSNYMVQLLEQPPSTPLDAAGQPGSFGPLAIMLAKRVDPDAPQEGMLDQKKPRDPGRTRGALLGSAHYDGAREPAHVRGVFMCRVEVTLLTGHADPQGEAVPATALGASIFKKATPDWHVD